MRRADRLFQIIQILRRTPRPITAAALAAELETSKRSVYRDIAIDRPLGGLELGGKCSGGYRSGRPAQNLDDLKKPVGASHEPLSRHDADSMMAAGWQ